MTPTQLSAMLLHMNNNTNTNNTKTAFVPTRDQLIGFISDGEKEIWGFRPRPVWSELSYEQLDQWGRELSAQLTRHRKEQTVRRRQLRKIRKAAHRMWVAKKATYFTPVEWNIGILVNI